MGDGHKASRRPPGKLSMELKRQKFSLAMYVFRRTADPRTVPPTSGPVDGGVYISCSNGETVHRPGSRIPGGRIPYTILWSDCFWGAAWAESDQGPARPGRHGHRRFARSPSPPRATLTSSCRGGS